jgi:outer membrane biogenesis lipoprotein LolB
MKTVLSCLAAALLATGAAAQAPPENRPIGDMRMHDFAAKWMMQQDDMADIDRYARANAVLIASGDTRPRVVLLGDSITFH